MGERCSSALGCANEVQKKVFYVLPHAGPIPRGAWDISALTVGEGGA